MLTDSKDVLIDSNSNVNSNVELVTETEKVKVIVDTVVDTVVDNVVSKIHLDKYLSFIRDDNIKKIVTVLTTDASAVQDVINMIDLILADGKIDISDAPLLLGLIKKITTLRTKEIQLSQPLSLDQFLDIIKLVFTILAKEEVLKITNTDEFIKDIVVVLDGIKVGNQIVSNIPDCSCIGWFSKFITKPTVPESK